MEPAETPAERQARQFAQLRNAGRLAMTLLELSGNAAIAELTAEAEAKPGAEPPPSSRRSDHARSFEYATRAIRQIITLELRVEAGPATPRAAAAKTPATAPAPAAPAPPPDPRRPLLQQVLHDAVRNDPNKVRRRREIDENIDRELLADPGGDEIIAETLHTICLRLNIDIDPSRLSDTFLEYDEPIKILTRPKTRDHP